MYGYNHVYQLFFNHSFNVTISFYISKAVSNSRNFSLKQRALTKDGHPTQVVLALLSSCINSFLCLFPFITMLCNTSAIITL